MPVVLVVVSILDAV